MNNNIIAFSLTRLAKRLSLVVVAILATTAALQAQDPILEFIDNGRGPVPLYLPSTYDPIEPLPLIVALHGFMQDGPDVEALFDFVDQIESERFLYAIPEGEANIFGLRFWNATDACCDFFGNDPDDSTYLRELIDLIRSQYSVDELSIHFVGYSNGGFMSHRMAIDHADTVASILSLAGANFFDAGAHDPSEPVHVLQVHGTADNDILYNGGFLLGVPYPGAVQTQLNWTVYNGLLPDPQQVGQPFNLDLVVSGNETTSQIFDLNNPFGIKVELWTMTGTDHFPNFGEGTANLFAQRGVDWLLSHRKPSVTQVNVDSINITLGTLVSGGIVELDESDDQYVVMNPQFLTSRYQNVFTIDATAPTDTPSVLEFSLEAKVLNFIGTVDQKVELLNYDTGQFETVDNRFATAMDSVVAVTPGGDPIRFVQGGTGAMQARISYQNSLPFWVTGTANLNLPFRTSVDQIFWTITP